MAFHVLARLPPASRLIATDVIFAISLGSRSDAVAPLSIPTASPSPDPESPMSIFPIDDPQDSLAAHLPEGYPWDHDGDEPIHSMRGAPLRDRLDEIRLDMADDADRERDEAGSSDRWWV